MSNRRRGRGEGSITKRKDGRWMARVDLGWAGGRRKYKAVYGKTRKDVASGLPKLLQSAHAGTLITDERVTTAQFLKRWLTYKQSGLRPRTLTTYQLAVELHLNPGIGKIPIARLTPQHVAEWFQAHQADGASPRTIQYARAVLRVALNKALGWNLVTRNVATLVDPPRQTKHEIQPLTPEQARVLLASVRQHRLGAVVSVATALGLRQGEALGLRWSDVDFDAGTLSVRQALERSGGDRVARAPLLVQRKALRAAIATAPPRSIERHTLRQQLEENRAKWRSLKSTIRFVEPKSARSRRTIRMPGVVVSALKAHRKHQLQERMAVGPAWTDSGLVFVSPLGTPLEPRNVARTFAGMLTAAKLPHIRFHDLRHTAATLLLAQGIDPRTIMETLGHSQISLTLNTYSHVLPTLQAEAAAKMDAIFNTR
jgi:integrase